MAYCAKNCVSTNSNNYVGSGGSTLKKKYANKFNKVSANKPFSLNGYSNHNYIGNVNTIAGQVPSRNVSSNMCCTANDSVGLNNRLGISVKTSKGYLNSKMTSNNSAKCYKDVNKGYEKYNFCHNIVSKFFRIFAAKNHRTHCIIK